MTALPFSNLKVSRLLNPRQKVGQTFPQKERLDRKFVGLTGAGVYRCLSYMHEANHWLVSTIDNDIFPVKSFVNQLGELGLA